jgi:hypothetical protein
MDQKLRQVSQLLKRYDSELIVKRYLDSSLGIFRKRRGWDFFHFDGETKYALWFSVDFEDLVIPCTDNWTDLGKPVDQGIEPIFWKVQQLDGWRYDDYEDFVAGRAERKRNRDRAFKNEMRARAADLRREFAKATNDINTSTIEKIERRK